MRPDPSAACVCRETQERSWSELQTRVSQANSADTRVLCMYCQGTWAKMKFFSFCCLFLQLLIADKIKEQVASTFEGENRNQSTTPRMTVGPLSPCK